MKTYDEDLFRTECAPVLARLASCADEEAARRAIWTYAEDALFAAEEEAGGGMLRRAAIVRRDCVRAVHTLTAHRSDRLAGFSVARALWDLARRRPRPDLREGFRAEMIHLFRGVAGRPPGREPLRSAFTAAKLHGREAAIARSGELDALWDNVEQRMARYPDGLSAEAVARRAARRAAVLEALGGAPADWDDWRWHTGHVLDTPALLERTIRLRPREARAVRRARAAGLPFGITPYYASLMDDDPEAGRDRAVRAQVLPPPGYVRRMAARRGTARRACDFMLEQDTSPVDLVTRRYPSVAILKPFNTCPQICVYCQRNWEIDRAMAPGALAPPEQIEAALRWIEEHPAIRELLITGGDPLGMDDETLGAILERTARIRSLDFIRIGTRVPATLPMRVTDALADRLGALREPGRREVAVVTHIEHPYEITPELAGAVDRLRRRGVAVYNQLVFTYFVSRRFEAARLRMLLRRCGIAPYYTFAPKGKGETADYRVPIARLLQERKEETRLLPGMRRTDEPVFNLPGLGKNYLRGGQHRDLVAVLPDGARVYEFHPWEKNIVQRRSYVGREPPILDYLRRLERDGEDPEEYERIWYYF